MTSMRNRRYGVLLTIVAVLFVLFMLVPSGPKTTAKGYLDQYLEQSPSRGKPIGERVKGKPLYLPEPDWVPPPIKDPFPSLSVANEPPAIPEWNAPRNDLHGKYDLEYPPPLFIGFTRSWPLLLQTVVSYITAGWPADKIYIIENTGVQRSNAKGQLTLQNPFYLNHEQLSKLGVNVIQAPVLMSFSQLQNFYMYLSHQYQWPYYFWSHQDVVALSYEDGKEGVTPKAHEEGYKTMYELALVELNKTLESNERWAQRNFAGDNLAMINREAFEDVGGWDTFIPYYMTECDMHSRLYMGNWTIKDGDIGIIADVGASIDDLRVLYRDESVKPGYSDPNPPKPAGHKRDAVPAAALEKNKHTITKRAPADGGGAAAPVPAGAAAGGGANGQQTEPASLLYYRQIMGIAEHMQKIKKQNENRNNWQGGQRGGKDEPFYYPSQGISRGVDILTAAGRQVFAEKWGHRECDLITGAGLKLEDSWRVAKDWE